MLPCQIVWEDFSVPESSWTTKGWDGFDFRMQSPSWGTSMICIFPKDFGNKLDTTEILPRHARQILDILRYTGLPHYTGSKNKHEPAYVPSA